MALLLVAGSLGVAAFLFARALAQPARPAAQRWREKVLGNRGPTRDTPAKRRRESLRTKSLFERLVQAPPRLARPADRLIGAAGMSDRMTGASFAGFALSLGFTILIAWVLFMLPGGITQNELLLSVPIVGLGFGAPWIVVSGRANRRRNAIDLALPDLLDLLTVSVEAGLAIEAALVRVSERGKSPLHEEVRRSMSEIALGRRRRDALLALAQRVNVPPVASLVNAMNQADRSGMELGPVLRAQADQVRQRRRQRAESAAMKAPIKMLFPLVFFIFPAMFIVILGPAALNLKEVFA